MSLSHQFLMSNVFRIFRTTVIKIKLIIFFHFTGKLEKGANFLKHSVFVFSHFMRVTRISSMSSVLLLAPNPGDATECFLATTCTWETTVIDGEVATTPELSVAISQVSLIAARLTRARAFNGPLSRTTRLSRYQKGKTSG